MQCLNHSLRSSAICLRARIVAPVELFIIPGVVSRDHHLRLQVECVKELNLQKVCNLRCLVYVEDISPLLLWLSRDRLRSSCHC